MSATAMPAAPSGTPQAPSNPHLQRLQEAADLFAENTTEHTVTVLHEQGLYRHIRFGKPGTSMYSSSIITWPGALAVTGDMGSFLFERDSDMFAWFRGGLSPDYRASKCAASDGIRRYSQDLLSFRLREQLTEWVEDLRDQFGTDDDDDDDDDHELDDGPSSEPARPARRAVETVHSTLLNGDIPPEAPTRQPTAGEKTLEAAIRELTEEVDDLITYYGADHHSALQAMHEFRCEVRLPDGRTRTYSLEDAYEWGLEEWTTQYLWSLHAVCEVIRRLDERQAPEPDVSTPERGTTSTATDPAFVVTFTEPPAA